MLLAEKDCKQTSPRNAHASNAPHPHGVGYTLGRNPDIILSNTEGRTSSRMGKQTANASAGRPDPVSTEAGPLMVAVVLTWNDVEMTRVCVRSVLDNTYHPLAVVVVDNGSSFPTLAPLQEEFPGIETVQLAKNFGFAGGCNRGLEKALEMGADYIFLLNNDTIVDRQAGAELAQAMETHKDAALASAVLLHPGEDKRIQIHCVWPNRDRAHGVHENVNKTLTDALRKTVETGFAPACAVLLRPEALRQVGLFDERLFTNWEDYDLCMRLTDAGYKLLMVGSAEVVHKHGQTTGTTSPFITYFSVRNRLTCLFRYGRWRGILANLPWLIRSFWTPIWRRGLADLAGQRAYLKGVLHFLLGVDGGDGAPTKRDDN